MTTTERSKALVQQWAAETVARQRLIAELLEDSAFCKSRADHYGRQGYTMLATKYLELEAMSDYEREKLEGRA